MHAIVALFLFRDRERQVGKTESRSRAIAGAAVRVEPTPVSLQSLMAPLRGPKRFQFPSAAQDVHPVTPAVDTRVLPSKFQLRKLDGFQFPCVNCISALCQSQC